MNIKSVQLTFSKGELQQLLSEKVARKGVFLDVENPVLSLPDGKIKIDCELNPVLCPRTAATIEFSVGMDRGMVVIDLLSVAAWARPLGGLFGNWKFDGEWTKNKIMEAISRAINGRPGMKCTGNRICVSPNELSVGKVKIIGSLKLIRISESLVEVDIG